MSSEQETKGEGNEEDGQRKKEKDKGLRYTKMRSKLETKRNFFF